MNQSLIISVIQYRACDIALQIEDVTDGSILNGAIMCLSDFSCGMSSGLTDYICILINKEQCTINELN